MNIIASKKFRSNLEILSAFELESLADIYDKLTLANSISEINCSRLVGMPYLHTIEFGKYVIGIQVKKMK
ncbi:MAG: hypothetical protein EAZ27_05630 [Cytophagales bacterium]|nr:MAG: hypothetical protein EAZ38_13505 [Cytophagales bacterium]TAG56162.1 MAG: hypothetical protein EAZ27_05630 [Cytophagales bacterium]